MKRIISILLCVMIACSLTACASAKYNGIGSGIPGVVAKLDWSKYDELLDQSIYETDLNKRSLILHQAEEMLMDTYAMVPIYYGKSYFLMKQDCHGAYSSKMGNLYFYKMYRDGDDGSQPISIYCTKEVNSIDAVANCTSDVSNLTVNTSAALLKYDENGQLIPDLAEGYEVSDNGCTYTFTLRDNLKWSDGSILDAHDFEYSWRRAAASENGFDGQTNFDVIKGYPDDLAIEASEDGKIFTVHLNVPTAFFPGLCAYSAFYPVQEEYAENYPGYRDGNGNVANPSVWASEAGFPTAGPYVVESWKHNESIILKKNPYYYDADKIITEEFDLMLNGDSASIYGAYASDTIDLAFGGIPNDVRYELMSSSEYHSNPGLSTAGIYFNVIDSSFAGMTVEEAVNVRKALALAIDRSFICSVALQSGSTPATTFVPLETCDGTGGEFGDCQDYKYPYENGYYESEPDLDEARRLLESVGYEFDKDGKLKTNLTVEYVFVGTADNEAVATCIQADWAQLGINTNLSSRESTVFYGERAMHNSESYRGSWTADYDDPYTFLQIFRSNSPNNDCALGLEPKS